MTDERDPTPHRLGPLALRAAAGGTLMGLANLVPGISGGTMLLAAGVYPAFIAALADVTTLRFRARSLVLLAGVGGAAALAILLLAGPTRTLVVEQRWIMYSLFIGLTLGGVPLVWRLARPATPALWVGAAVGFALMLVMAWSPGAEGDAGGADFLLLGLSGMAGAGAMILPGVSGGYLLLLLGQYLPILGAIDGFKLALLGLRGSGLDAGLLADSLRVLVPVGLGVAAGVIGVSNLLRLALDRFPKPTLGALLGLLVGAVFGLWPFQEEVPPTGGAQHGASPAAREIRAEAEPGRVVPYAPDAAQAAMALGLVLAGVAATAAIGRLGAEERAVSDVPEVPRAAPSDGG